MRSFSSPKRPARRGARRTTLRVAGPAAVVVAAVALGMVAFGPARGAPSTGSAPAQPGALPGSLLAAATTTSSAGQLQRGQTLFDESCASCHGSQAQGSALAPNLQGLGAATVDLWVSSGWMPLANPTAQPIKKTPKFGRSDTVAIANYVQSLGGGPKIPKVNLAGTSVSSGMSVFALNCAPCHTITGAGDALSNGITAPSLHDVTKTQIAEAVRTGPGNMPRFSPKTLSDQHLLDVISNVTKDIQHPKAPGGLDLGGVGPVAEGFIGLFVGVGLCVLAAFWIGDRTPRDIDEEAAHTDGTHDPGTAHV